MRRGVEIMRDYKRAEFEGSPFYVPVPAYNLSLEILEGRSHEQEMEIPKARPEPKPIP